MAKKPTMQRWSVFRQNDHWVKKLGTVDALDAEAAIVEARRVYGGGKDVIGIVRQGAALPSAETRDELEHPKGTAGYFKLAKAMQRAGFNGRNRRR